MHCKLSSWAPWGLCSKTCGHGRQKRLRTVDIQASNGGRQCLEKRLETRHCKKEDCLGNFLHSYEITCFSYFIGNFRDVTFSTIFLAGDCQYTTWTAWEKISSSCMVIRTRKIHLMPMGGGRPCEDDELKQERDGICIRKLVSAIIIITNHILYFLIIPLRAQAKALSHYDF